MNAQFHTPSFGDDNFHMGDAQTSTPTSSCTSECSFSNNSSSTYRHNPSSKRFITVHNTSDEYHTANEESFSSTAQDSTKNSISQQNISTSKNSLASEQARVTTPTTMAARKQMLPVDQNEPAKPLSAYALFFRDTVSAIKQQNPTCSFPELSKIVASMWDALDPVHKGVYNKKNELARTEYLKQMRIYQQQKQEQENANTNESIYAGTVVQQQTQQVTQQLTNNANVSQNAEQVINSSVVTSNNANTVSTTAISSNSSAPTDQMSLIPTPRPAQKCTRETCNKRAIINPDWEDEYCSNECVIIHCRNVFNTWVQSNLEAKEQQQHQLAPAQTSAT